MIVCSYHPVRVLRVLHPLLGLRLLHVVRPLPLVRVVRQIQHVLGRQQDHGAQPHQEIHPVHGSRQLLVHLAVLVRQDCQRFRPVHPLRAHLSDQMIQPVQQDHGVQLLLAVRELQGDL